MLGMLTTEHAKTAIRQILSITNAGFTEPFTQPRRAEQLPLQTDSDFVEGLAL